MLLGGGGGCARLQMAKVGLDPSVDLLALIVQARRKMVEMRLDRRTA